MQSLSWGARILQCFLTQVTFQEMILELGVEIWDGSKGDFATRKPRAGLGRSWKEKYARTQDLRRHFLPQQWSKKALNLAGSKQAPPTGSQVGVSHVIRLINRTWSGRILQGDYGSRPWTLHSDLHSHQRQMTHGWSGWHLLRWKVQGVMILTLGLSSSWISSQVLGAWVSAWWRKARDPAALSWKMPFKSDLRCSVEYQGKVHLYSLCN